MCMTFNFKKLFKIQNAIGLVLVIMLITLLFQVFQTTNLDYIDILSHNEKITKDFKDLNQKSYNHIEIINDNTNSPLISAHDSKIVGSPAKKIILKTTPPIKTAPEILNVHIIKYESVTFGFDSNYNFQIFKGKVNQNINQLNQNRKIIIIISIIAILLGILLIYFNMDDKNRPEIKLNAKNN